MTRLRRAGAGVGALALTGSLLAALPTAALPTAAAAAEDPATFVSQRIALGGDGVFPNYRIPAIVQLENGDILASYDGRPTGWDAPGPNSILQRRSTDNGQTWGEQTVVAQGSDGEVKHGYSDPSYVYDRETGTLFNFHVFSKDTGFWNSVEGDGDADRQVMSASVSVSTDGGRTWSERSVTQIVKPAGVRATFASSGHGIQIQNGPHAGRLVLQYAGAMTDGTVQAYSVYSDDHGETWTMGAPTGTNMDENKVVELDDGTLMLNSRMHTGGTWRYVARSTDGGATWSEPQIDHTLTDPRNNASIIRMNPSAESGTAEAKELLFSNANSTAGRQNGSVRYSCDNGATWPVVTTFNPGNTQYSDLLAKQDGTFGVLYEAADNEIRYGEFGEEWLKPFCATFEPAAATLGAGETAELSVTVRNDDEVALPAGTATVALPEGWTATTALTPALEPGAAAEVTIAVTAPENAALGVTRGDVVVQAGTYRVRGDAEFTIDQAAPAHVGATITSRPGAERDVATEPYAVGDQIPITFGVTGTGNVIQTVTPLAGNVAPFTPPGAGNCRWRNLPVGGAYDCATPRSTVTEEDVANGFIQVRTTWELTAEGVETQRVEHVGAEIDVRVREPQVEIVRTVGALVDVDGDGSASAGDILPYTLTVTNTGNVRLTGIEGAATAGELAAGAGLTVDAAYTLTAEDVAAGVAELPAATVGAANGALDIDAEAGAQAVALAVAPGVTPNVFLTENNSADAGLAFALPVGAEVFAGDWDGDGVDTLGWREGNRFTFTSVNAGGGALHSMWYGKPSDEVLAGDWDGDGDDTVSVRRGNEFHIANHLNGGHADDFFWYGKASDEVVAADFDGDGDDTVSVRRGNGFHVNNALQGGNADSVFWYGKPGEPVLVGDLDGDGNDSVVVRRGTEFHLRNSLTTGNADRVVELGDAADLALLGDWNGDGTDTLGFVRR